MNKQEQLILKEKIINDYNQLYDSYINIMKRLFPEQLGSPYERFLNDHKDYVNDGNVLDIIWDIQREEYETTSYYQPTHIMNLFYDYVYQYKEGLNEDEKQLIKKFEQILRAKFWLNNHTDELKDTDILTFNNQNIIITDPCYVFSKDWLDKDWTKLLNNYIYHSTLIGDVTTTFYKNDINIDMNKDFLKLFQQPELGTCTADAGLIGVFKLDDVLGYDSNFKDNYLSKDFLVMQINNFTGTVQIKVAFDFSNYEFFYYVEGLGNINFIGLMTSF